MMGNMRGEERRMGVPSAEADEIELGKTLFVGDLSRDIDVETLKDHFLQFGEVINIDIKRDRMTSNSLGYGFVEFQRFEDALEAKKQLSGARIGERAIRLGWAQKNTNLFIGDLDASVTSEILFNEFKQFGPLFEEDTFVKEGMSYGFVRFRKREDAETAKREMQGKNFHGRVIRIGWGDAKSIDNCVHFRFDTSQSKAAISEATVRDVFGKFGNVESVSLPRNSDDTPKGFGFVYFSNSSAGQAAANNAIAEVNGKVIAGVELTCKLGKKPNKKKSRKQYPAPMYSSVNRVGGFPVFSGAYPVPRAQGMQMGQQQHGYGGGRGRGRGGMQPNSRHMRGGGMHAANMQMSHMQYSPFMYHVHGNAAAFHPQQAMMMSPQYMQAQAAPGSPPMSPSSPLITAGGMADMSPTFNASLPPTASVQAGLPNALSMGLPGSPAFRAAADVHPAHTHRAMRGEEM
uniref:RRM domain-containing protein n=1 Tax=Palpitomonas bilix TaxID=652834 RepID=A0A7S3DFR0_9EUKA|mmetsp:Transcript_35547/g.92666  ORF Transcript_35547/g.92666 Transcript_35547/m.92666 type:complete len:459 (+) Transcript_35547:391-1767(+)|eukprot:CAMPEP_0113881196 /NCGR_PEP_ID=MMETSP0780_2-20120614/8231_1 /TAXON_ID=652834 /ORGANISM="Palpitomonas bilix" /LENGTH=458 /DNA_ID=CAMNT_0000868005 /DNA_START=267 /DNA_END=1643 /DNA_ORIENTATION=- /assembly_acc=CAM_ASM_000599